ncbi:DUF7503 family protein [Halocalculus aciditolerans]|nr:hypothetical protein [Halocalculus aciditolerans]
MTDLNTFLSEHPRMIGVVFTMVLLVSQAGSVAGINHVAGP